MTDNLRIWSQVEKTNPAYTKKVNQRGGFTSINAAFQVMRATEVFGPIGEGWGYDAEEPIFHDLLVIVPVTLWHSSDKTKRFGPMFGGAEWKSDKGRLDSDAVKKATTDALTKLLSQLGFSADVFLGLYDDDKYLKEVEAEFRPPSPAVNFAIATMRTCRDLSELTEFWTKNAKGLRADLHPADFAKVEAAKDGEKVRLTEKVAA